MNGIGNTVICDFCKQQVAQSVAGEKRLDWFTGYLKQTFHCCARCMSTSEIEREFNARLKKSRIRPATEVDKNEL